MIKICYLCEYSITTLNNINEKRIGLKQFYKFGTLIDKIKNL